MFPQTPTPKVGSSVASSLPAPTWRSVTWPKEHGSWSLVLEPLALGLIAAPSAPGFAFALALLAGFFARRPLRIWARGSAGQRHAARQALVPLGIVAVGAVCAALAWSGTALLGWLTVMGALTAVFLWFDLQNDGREAAAETAGTIAFALASGALAAATGWPVSAAAAVALTMLGRAVPTIWLVRTLIRGAKTGQRHFGLARALAIAAPVVTAWLAYRGIMPWLVPVLLAGLSLRALVLTGWSRPAPRARTLGLFELVVGAVYVVTAGVAWRCFANA